jgi:hypothetical protein
MVVGNLVHDGEDKPREGVTLGDHGVFIVCKWALVPVNAVVNVACQIVLHPLHMLDVFALKVLNGLLKGGWHGF